mmetsp:Transcript_30197/g.99942  ORF Transcript_30197/g.99942 Transcript_30197/m.99942 type:complete len:209 (-) Transcript_30197:321-947(-)
MPQDNAALSVACVLHRDAQLCASVPLSLPCTHQAAHWRVEVPTLRARIGTRIFGDLVPPWTNVNETTGQRRHRRELGQDVDDAGGVHPEAGDVKALDPQGGAAGDETGDGAERKPAAGAGVGGRGRLPRQGPRGLEEVDELGEARGCGCVAAASCVRRGRRPELMRGLSAPPSTPCPVEERPPQLHHRRPQRSRQPSKALALRGPAKR